MLDESGEADGVLKKFIDIKLSLMPYIYTTAVETNKTGVPMLRPLFVEFPEDPATWNVDTQYMLGPNLLVAPVFNAEGCVQYYLPKGNWYGVLDGKVRTGPGFITETHDFFSIPLLVRPGSAVVFGKEWTTGGKVHREAHYDYTEGITVLVNPDGADVDLEVELADSKNLGEIAAVLKIKGTADAFTVDVVKGSVSGAWKVKKILADGSIKEFAGSAGAKSIKC